MHQHHIACPTVINLFVTFAEEEMSSTPGKSELLDTLVNVFPWLK